METGKFITLEGIDGAGKSTQLEFVVAWLQEKGVSVVVTREPGGTLLGEQLRSILLDNSTVMHPETEALLMFASRREHLDKVIAPALEQGKYVVSDRFTDASFAYQGGGRGVNWEKIGILESWVQGDLQPDLTLFSIFLLLWVSNVSMQSKHGIVSNRSNWISISAYEKRM